MPSDLPRRIWFALLAPPVAWFVALNAAYFMVDPACGSPGARVALHATILVPLAVAILAGAIGFRVWRRRGEEWPGEGPDPDTRTRFLGVLATLAGIVFGAAILWFWLAAAVLDPCEPEPRGRFAPSAMMSASTGGAEAGSPENLDVWDGAEPSSP